MSCQHNFAPINSSPYYKQQSKNECGLTTYDHTISYVTLYCNKCGETKEVVAADYLKPKA